MKKSIYDFSIKTNEKTIDLNEFRGKPILLINIASFCGYVGQLGLIQELYNEYNSRGLEIILVPSNSFWQEYKSDNKINSMCVLKYNIKSIITKKVNVKGNNADNIYKWILSEYNKKPTWNYHKFLFDTEGNLVEDWACYIKPNDLRIKK